jgi:hypothetical protein
MVTPPSFLSCGQKSPKPDSGPVIPDREMPLQTLEKRDPATDYRGFFETRQGVQFSSDDHLIAYSKTDFFANPLSKKGETRHSVFSNSLKILQYILKTLTNQQSTGYTLIRYII